MIDLETSAPECPEPPYSLIPVPTVPLSSAGDHTEAFQREMIFIHNVYIRGLNSIWHNAPLVKPQDKLAFAGYALSCTTATHGHHHGEETIIFPFLSTKLDMSHNLEQHEAFQGGLAQFDRYFENVQKKAKKYDAVKARELLRGFADDLVPHLYDEIPTITPEHIAKFHKADWDAMMKVHQKHIEKQGMFTVVPFTSSHHDFVDGPNWPPIPPPLKWVARNIAGRVHPSYWKFSPFDLKGNPQKYAGYEV